MKDFVDEIAWGIFGEKSYELSYDETGRYSIYRTKEKAEKAMDTVQPTMWPWRVASIRIQNGGFVSA